MATSDLLKFQLQMIPPKGRRRRRPPKWLHPSRSQRLYKASLLWIITSIERAFKEVLQPALPGLTRKSEGDSIQLDAWDQELGGLVEKMRLRIDQTTPKPDTITGPVGNSVASFNREQWRKVVKESIGVDMVTSEPWLKPLLGSWARENASLITSLKETAIGDVEKMALRGVRTGQRHEEIAKSILERFDVSRSRASLIARDQVSKLNGDITKKQQTSAGVTAYFWRTSGDERVRDSHRRKDGERFEWSNPPPDTGHPGADYQCRCNAEPDFSEILKEWGG